jgi:hypothetical protein
MSGEGKKKTDVIEGPPGGSITSGYSSTGRSAKAGLPFT